MSTSLLLVLLFALSDVPVSQGAQDPLAVSPMPLEVRITADGHIGLDGQPLGSVADLSRLRERLRGIFSARRKNRVYDADSGAYKREGISLPVARRVTVKADIALNFADVLRVLHLVRGLDAKPLDLEVTAGGTKVTAMIPTLADPHSSVAPDPLALVVGMDKDRRLSLNLDPQASLTALSDRLKAIFAGRRGMKAYYPGTEEVYAAVFVKADASLPFGEVVNLLDAVRGAGADPLGLQIDDLSAPRPQPNKRSERTANDRVSH